MFFNVKILVSGVTVLGGIGIPCYLFSGGGCSSSYISIPWNSELGSNNAVLECKENDRDYSIYLVLKEGEKDNSKTIATFKVVDNKTQKIMWGPRVDKKDEWDKWGIEISYENDGVTRYALSGQDIGKKDTKIRIPTKKFFYQGTVKVTCQKSMVQMKKGGGDCKGTFLQSKYMEFDIQKTGCDKRLLGGRYCNVSLARKTEWNTGFQPKAVLCNS